MDYINQIVVGGTTYNIQDARLNQPVDFQSVISQTSTTAIEITVSWAAGETDMWKMGEMAIPGYITEVHGTEGVASTKVVFTNGTAPTGSTRLYPGDMIYAYQRYTNMQGANWEVVPSADNPHKHSIPALAGLAASSGAHTHSFTAKGTLDTKGGHSHTVNVSASLTGTKGSHSHSIPALSGTATSAGAHTHDLSGTATGLIYLDAMTTGTGAGSASFTGQEHTHSVTATGNVGESGSHSHTFTGTASNTGKAGAATYTSASSGGHSHTFTGTAVNSTQVTSTVKSVSSNGAHTHAITYSKATSAGTAHADKASVNGTQLIFTDVSAVSGITNTATTVNTDEKGGHTHSITMNSHSHSVTAAGNIGTVDGHTHEVTVSSHSHSFTPAGTLNSAGAHTHSFTGTATSTGKATQGGTVTIVWPIYSGDVELAISGEALSAGAHTHAVGTVATNTGNKDLGLGISVTATLDTAGAHSHTFTGSAATTGEAGGHTHSVSTTANETGISQ